jgi:hypothetical protein
MMNNLPVYDIVLIPPQPVYQTSIAISQQLEHFGTEFTLSDNQRYPHLSLYMANFTPENLEKVKIALANIAANNSGQSLQALRYLHDFEQGMFEVAYDKNHDIVHLQQQIIEALNPLRTGLRVKDPVGHVLQDWLPQTSGEARTNLETWGYDEIGGLFRPHITFTRFKKHNREVDVTLLPPLHELDCRFATLGIYEMGEHGTCIRPIATYQQA